MKYALVTGSTRGMGFSIAKKLSENGYFVYTNGRGDIPISIDNSQYIIADLSTIDGLNTIVSNIQNKLDVVVLNVGMTCRKSMQEIDYSDWQKVMDTTVNIPFFITQKLGVNDNGSIVFISSAMSLKPHATSIPYGVSKAAVNMLAQSLVKEFAPRNIRVNVVCPGFIDTEWQKEKPDWLREKIENKIALKRFGLPEEIADMCLSIINNNYINGAIISVDGGYDME
ncbi:beta-ketoacyl-ACP reductase [Clostridia bacterium]|nr:beta-ketoacyl-ACP reductase [Clostridia bacterium]